jgi:hypothetical protein
MVHSPAGCYDRNKLAEILLCSTLVTVFFIAIAIAIVIGFCQKLAFDENLLLPNIGFCRILANIAY